MKIMNKKEFLEVSNLYGSLTFANCLPNLTIFLPGALVKLWSKLIYLLIKWYLIDNHIHAKLKPGKGSRVQFYKNGKPLGVAFTDIHDGVYYPAISLFKSAKVIIIELICSVEKIFWPLCRFYRILRILVEMRSLM